MELYRAAWGERGGRDTHVPRAELRSDGSLRISGRDSGPGIEGAFYQDEIEARMTIRAEDLPSFLLAALRLGFGSKERMTLGPLREPAEAAGIETNLESS